MDGRPVLKRLGGEYIRRFVSQPFQAGVPAVGVNS
jgi:hypothetical protein